VRESAISAGQEPVRFTHPTERLMGHGGLHREPGGHPVLPPDTPSISGTLGSFLRRILPGPDSHRLRPLCNPSRWRPGPRLVAVPEGLAGRAPTPPGNRTVWASPKASFFFVAIDLRHNGFVSIPVLCRRRPRSCYEEDRGIAGSPVRDGLEGCNTSAG